jgi:hypothetical protein
MHCVAIGARGGHRWGGIPPCIGGCKGAKPLKKKLGGFLRLFLAVFSFCSFMVHGKISHLAHGFLFSVKELGL